MMFDLTDKDTLYKALIAKDPSYDGRAYVCVTSTGIFCRLTCPAKKPKFENCIFKLSVAECLADGYRACKRCHPVKSAIEDDAALSRLLDDLEDNPQHRWSEQDLISRGLDPSTIRRVFKRQFGITFLEMARQRRLKEGFTHIGRGEKVIDAQLEAGFESASAFRTAFAKLIGCPPNSLKNQGRLMASWFATPLGDMIAVACATHVHLLEFVDRKALPTELKKLMVSVKGDMGIGESPPIQQLRGDLDAYFAGHNASFKTPIKLHGSPFSQTVWQALLTIPAGETRSYAQLAASIGQPSAVRAVARANGANQLALIIPCHRVIGADGSLTGYGGGLWRKQRLLEIEARYR